jgi:hypothetical protein
LRRLDDRLQERNPEHRSKRQIYVTADEPVRNAALPGLLTRHA